jgi:hypothetical protein
MTSPLIRPIIGIENRTAQEVFDIMCDRIAASAHMPGSQKPVAWHCKDYADGWINFDNEAEALAYQKDTGCLIRIVYRPTGDA